MFGQSPSHRLGSVGAQPRLWFGLPPQTDHAGTKDFSVRADQVRPGGLTLADWATEALGHVNGGLPWVLGEPRTGFDQRGYRLGDDIVVYIAVIVQEVSQRHAPELG
jgi:hypothetical protein